jgi:arylsulfatase A-like enzyme
VTARVQPGSRAARWLDGVQAVAVFPAAVVGLVLPLDFLYQIDGYRMYLGPLAIARLFAHATIVYLALAVGLAVPVALLTALLARLAGWPVATAWRTVFSGVALAPVLLTVIRTAKLYLQHLDVPVGALFGHKWLLIGAVVALCLVAAYRGRHRRGGVARWATVSSAFVLAVAAPCFVVGWLTSAARAEVSGVPSTAPAAPGRPDIVLLTIDAFAARHSPVYGYARDTTPALGRLAREASTFERFYANGNYTVPGVASLLYGSRPWTHRAFKLGDPVGARNSLIAQLRRHGYTTLAVVSNTNASPQLHLTAEYFDRSVDCAARIQYAFCVLFHVAPLDALDIMGLGFFRHTVEAFDIALVRAGIWSTTDHGDPETVFAEARDMLTRRRPGVPFFLWLHLLPPHDPYAAPPPFGGRFDPGPARRSRLDSSPAFHWAAGHDPAFPHGYVGRYDESLLYVDAHVGRFLDWLRAKDLYDRTLIVVTSDHGESFSRGYGIHGGPLLHEDVIRIPLLVKEPEQRQPRRVPTAAEQADVAPTILALAGVPPHGGFEGRSLVPLLRGQALDRARPVFSMSFERNAREGPLTTGSVAMIDGDWKYVRYTGHPAAPRHLDDELYRLDVDPDERDNLAAAHRDVAAGMRSAIERQVEMHRARRE